MFRGLQVLDAYGQLVNTDSLLASGVAGEAPVVTVAINETDVFLSGVQSQPVRAGTAVLDDLRLVADPGQYTLALRSAGLTPSSIEVR